MALSRETQKFLDGLGMFGWKLGLDRMWAMVRELGMPQEQFAAIHIAGSNGKGSVARILESVYLQQGYRVGLYTSPHLISPAERIRINGRALTDSAFDALVRDLRPVLERHQATYFETMTMLAFVAFARSGIELAIVETGLGGRLDATNILHPRAAVITSISLEHQQYLGETLSAIAAEKAGIVKQGAPCIVGDLAPEPLAVVEQVCRTRQSRLIRARQRIRIDVQRRNLAGMQLTLFWPGEALLVAQTRLLGDHQVANMRTALATLAEMHPMFPVRLQAITEGLAAVTLPARMQVFQTDRLLILDVAHNPESMQALVETLKTTAPQKRWLVILGVLQDKDVESMMRPWQSLNAQFLCVRPPSERALNERTLCERLHRLGLKAEAFASMQDADSEAWRRLKAGRVDALLVTGSHYTVGQFMQFKKLGVS